MARLEIRLFGEVEVYLDGQLVRFPTQKAKELFAYLGLHHQNAHPRASLAGLLWPDSDEECAKASLRQTLSRLRKTLGPESELWIVASSGALRFHAKDAWIDVAEFEKLTQALSPSPLARERDSEAGVRALEEAITFYRGPFLCGIYEDWVLIEQERLQTLYLEVLEQLAHVYTERRDYDQAIKTWQRVLREIPWHEQAHRQLMELYALQGDRTVALHQYTKYVAVLRQELGATPLPEMRTLCENLQRGLGLPKSNAGALPAEMPFVGRQQELGILHQAWQDVLQGHGRAVFIEGEIGVGKTTFVEHFLRAVSASPLRGVAHPSGSGLPYQLLLQAVRSGLERTTTEALARLPALWRSELARVLPELHARFSDLPPNPELAPAQGKARWFEALTGFCEMLARERPFVLFFDDLHWADDATLEYLGHLVGAKHALPLLLIGTYRSEEALLGSRLRAWLDTLGPGRSYHSLTIQRLSCEETEMLLEQLLGVGARHTVPLLYDKTEGNPLFLRELTHSLIRSRALDRDEVGHWKLTVSEMSPAHLPEDLRELIRASLRRAPERAQKLLGVMAMKGHSCELPLLKEILHQREEKILDDLDALRRVGLIVEREERYQFYHELVRHVFYEELSADRKRLWHKQIGQALEELYPHELDVLAGELAEHFERAQQWEKAIAYAMRAGAHAQELYAYGEAKDFYKKSLELFKHLVAQAPLSDRLKRLKVELLQRYTGRGVFPTVADVRSALAELEPAVTEVVKLALELKDEFQLCEAYQRLARIRIAQNRWDAVRDARLKALDLGYQWIKKQPHGAGVASMLEMTGELNKQLYRYGAALNDYRQAAQMWAALGRTHQQGLVLGLMATMQLSVGRLAEARQSAERALECLHGGDLRRQAGVLNNLGLILRELGQLQDAQACYERALELMRASKDPRGIGIVLINLGALHSDQGDYAGALRYLEQALELLKQEGTKGLEVELFSEMGRAYVGLSKLPLALEYSTRAVRLIEEHQGFVTDEYLFYFRHFQMLQAQGQTDQARLYLQKAYEELHAVAAKIHEEDVRQSFLGKIRLHREILQAWEAVQRAR